MLYGKLGNEMWRWINQHDKSVGQRQNSEESNPWRPEHRAVFGRSWVRFPSETQNLLTLLKIQIVKISFFNDGGLKIDHFDIFDMLFPFLAFVKL